MPEYPSTPVDAVEKILVASGCDLKTSISPWASRRPGDVYESRVASKLIGKKYALAVYEYGSIDTDHELYLINLEEQVAEVIARHSVSTPACYWGGIEIVDLREENDEVLVTYRISKSRYRAEENFTARYILKAKKMVKENIVPELTKID